MGDLDTYAALLEKLSKFTTAASGLYIKCLEDANIDVLKEFVGASVQRMEELDLSPS